MRSVIRFWNSAIKACSSQPVSGSRLLRDVIFAGLQLARRGAECWTKEVSDALACLACGEALTSAPVGAVGEPQLRVVDLGKMVTALSNNIKDVWARAGECDPRAQQKATH